MSILFVRVYNWCILQYLAFIQFSLRHRRLVKEFDLVSSVLVIGWGAYARSIWWIAGGLVLLLFSVTKLADRTTLMFINHMLSFYKPKINGQKPNNQGGNQGSGQARSHQARCNYARNNQRRNNRKR